MKKLLLLLMLIPLLSSCFVYDYAFKSLQEWGWRIHKRGENFRRDSFESTKSYNEGKEQDLLKYRLEYYQADEKGKQIIASTIRMMYADYNADLLEPELREFLKKILYGGIK